MEATFIKPRPKLQLTRMYVFSNHNDNFGLEAAAAAAGNSNSNLLLLLKKRRGLYRIYQIVSPLFFILVTFGAGYFGFKTNKQISFVNKSPGQPEVLASTPMSLLCATCKMTM